jgi:RHS repeat-associated protein
LNQFSIFNGLGATYDANGNLASYNGWTYSYDAQNHLTTVKQGTTTVATYWYDGLNRQIRQTLNGGSPTFNVWDGWNLIEERGTGNTLQNAYVYGAGEIVEKITGTTPYFYYQDGSGNTSHLSDAAGNLLEKYTYSGFGQPTFYNAVGGQIPSSAYGVHHLFQGQLWTQETGLNDHRNRTALPTMGVFMQPDPIGFRGDPSNLYRYCGNNAVNWNDPTGEYFQYSQSGNNIHLYMPITYIGGTANTIGRLNAGITNAWTGTFGQGQYNVTMTVYSPSQGSPTNVVVLAPGTGISFTSGDFSGGVWFMVQPYDNLEGMAAHEAGHMMLLFYGLDGNLIDLSDIMGNINGSVSAKDIHDILVLGRSSSEIMGPVFQPSRGMFPGGLALFGHVLGGPALFNTGGGWQPIGSAPYDIRWAQYSGTGNWTAEQTAKAIELAGGLAPNAGEGTHPVAWELR